MASTSKLAALQKLRCNIFETAYNPTGARTGAKYLRKPLQGPRFLEYYQSLRRINYKSLNARYPNLDLVDMKEQQRLEDLEGRKRRGKGAPTKGEGKKATMGKKR